MKPWAAGQKITPDRMNAIHSAIEELTNSVSNNTNNINAISDKKFIKQNDNQNDAYIKELIENDTGVINFTLANIFEGENKKWASTTTIVEALNELNDRITVLLNRIETLENRNIDLLKFYKIGDIYITTNSTDPTGNGVYWIPFGQGRVLLGAGVGNDGTNSLTFSSGEAVGGEYYHTLISGEMPQHTHTYDVFPTVKLAKGTNYTALKYCKESSRSSKNTGEAGNNQAHNNIQPYIVVYFWKRVNQETYNSYYQIETNSEIPDENPSSD